MHDLIIVGAGTAGCVLAERLTASGRLNVLLLEAGGPPKSPFVRIPAGFNRLFTTEFDWNYTSEPQTAEARRIYTPRGKMLGGSSNINAQIHQWCHPQDYEQWRRMGATGWGWDDVQPVFSAQESWRGEGGSAVRGRSGPLKNEPLRKPMRLSRDFVAAARTAGLNGPDDYNGTAYEGAWISQISHDRGRRFSAYDAYLKPAMGRPNLEIMTGARVTRVLFENKRATGVEVQRGGRKEALKAGKGVVMSAGAFGTPQILMLSGVGPAAELRLHGIDVIQNVAEIGANLQDHPLIPVLFRTRGTDTFKRALSPVHLLRYMITKTGLLASNAVEAIAFVRTGLNEAPAPDLELIFVPFEWNREGLEPPSVHAFGIAPAVVAPLSRGRLALKTADPNDAPSIDFGLLSDPEGTDAKVIMEGVNWARKIAATEPLSADNAGELNPPPGDADEDLRVRIRRGLQTVYHPTSTCRMGSDEGAVVDPKLKVKGADGLWIADASVMPTVPRGHPNVPVAMVANRAAGWIENTS